ncbi:MAG: ChaN family lipoprotein [Paracoccaceae bacterium]|nr:ChaN family lipoprotein [Paracoccaceae bacterium]
MPAVFAAATLQAAPLDDAGLQRLARADIAILGERHDNPLHHNAQARIIAEIEPAALVFEMVPEALALTVTGEIRADAGRLEAHLDWDSRGWPDFAMYWPVFAAAPEATLFGAEVPRDELERAMEMGAAAALGGWGTIMGLDAPLPPVVQAAREEGMAEAHCDALPAGLLPGMVEAQRMRDGVLARAVLAALAETGGPVVVITGNGHARADWGVPALLAAAEPGLDVVTVGQFEAEPEGAQPFDYWTVAPAPERGDPCAAFR